MGRAIPWGALVLLAAGFAPLLQSGVAAAAEGGAGDGRFLVPQGTSSVLNGMVVLLESASGLHEMVLEAEGVWLCAYSQKVAHVALPLERELRHAHELQGGCFPLTGVKLHLVPGDLGGWVGLRLDPSRELVLHASEPFLAEFRNHSRFSDPAGDDLSTPPRDTPESSGFSQDVHGIHLFGEAPGTLAYTGRGELKILGPDVRVASSENVTTYRTGEEVGQDAVTVDGTISWVVVQFESARLRLTSPGLPFQIAAEDARMFEPDAVSLAARPGGPAFPWAAVALGAVALAACGSSAAFALRHRRRSAAPVGAPGLTVTVSSADEAPTEEEWFEFCVEYAAFAFDEADHRLAASCLAAARSYRPEAPGLAAWQGLCHERLGESRRALAAYRQAWAMAGPGRIEAAMRAAALCARTGKPRRALLWLRRAFSQDPRLAEEVAADAWTDDDPFRALRGHPALDRLIRRAQE